MSRPRARLQFQAWVNPGMAPTRAGVSWVRLPYLKVLRRARREAETSWTPGNPSRMARQSAMVMVSLRWPTGLPRTSPPATKAASAPNHWTNSSILALAPRVAASVRLTTQMARATARIENKALTG